MQIMRDGNKPEGESALYYTYTGPVVYTDQDKFKKIEFSAIEKNKPELPKASKDGWVGMIQHYFVTAWCRRKASRASTTRARSRRTFIRSACCSRWRALRHRRP